MLRQTPGGVGLGKGLLKYRTIKMHLQLFFFFFSPRVLYEHRNHKEMLGASTANRPIPHERRILCRLQQCKVVENRRRKGGTSRQAGKQIRSMRISPKLGQLKPVVRNFQLLNKAKKNNNHGWGAGTRGSDFALFNALINRLLSRLRKWLWTYRWSRYPSTNTQRRNPHNNQSGFTARLFQAHKKDLWWHFESNCDHSRFVEALPRMMCCQLHYTEVL